MSHNFATLHEIDVDDDNRPTILEGKLMSHDCIISVLKDMVDIKQKRAMQILPDNVIAQADDSLVWHVPGQVRTMLFKNGKKITRMAVPYPSLIFKVIDNSLSVAASKFKRKPKADDILYHSPLMNVYSDSRVCVGTADCPTDSEMDSMAGWEKVIFDTIFTHTNHTHCLLNKPQASTSTEQLYAFWKSLKGDNDFPNNRLNRLSDLTLEEWIEK
jgi:PRTRC genetic system protein B